MSTMIKVGMADLKICKAPDAITTLGLGSCVGIALRDPVTKVGGLAHIMLPDSKAIQGVSHVPKFADTGIEELVKVVVQAGATRSRLVAKIAGGAQMFSFQNKSELMTQALCKSLSRKDILVTAESNWKRKVPLCRVTIKLRIENLA